MFVRVSGLSCSGQWSAGGANQNLGGLPTSNLACGATVKSQSLPQLGYSDWRLFDDHIATAFLRRSGD